MPPVHESRLAESARLMRVGASVESRDKRRPAGANRCLSSPTLPVHTRPPERGEAPSGLVPSHPSLSDRSAAHAARGSAAPRARFERWLEVIAKLRQGLRNVAVATYSRQNNPKGIDLSKLRTTIAENYVSGVFD